MRIHGYPVLQPTHHTLPSQHDAYDAIEHKLRRANYACLPFLDVHIFRTKIRGTHPGSCLGRLASRGPDDRLCMQRVLIELAVHVPVVPSGVVVVA